MQNPNVNGLVEAIKQMQISDWKQIDGEKLIEYAVDHKLFRRIGDWSDAILWAYYRPLVRRNTEL